MGLTGKKLAIKFFLTYGLEKREYIAIPPEVDDFANVYNYVSNPYFISEDDNQSFRVDVAKLEAEMNDE